MKKLTIASLCIAAAFSATAQMSVIKEAKSSFKPGGDYDKFVEMITPAFTNPETANLAETWYTAGKEGFDNYDKLLLDLRLNQDVDKGALGRSLVKGYEFYVKALPLDSVPDSKGKVKPKYAKNIIKDIAKHSEDFNNAAVAFWEAKDFKGAYDAWGIYLDLPNQAFLGKEAPAALPDTIISMINFNRGLAAWQANNLENAMSCFDKAIALNYDDPAVYEYAAEVARLSGLPEKQFAYSEAGYKATNDPKYLSQMINHYIDAEDYATATNLLNTAIAESKDPRQTAYLYVLNGIIAERTNPEAAKGGANVEDNYRKAMELDPSYGGAFYNYGRIKLAQANAIDDAAGNMTGNEYNKLKNETLFPLMREAAENMEKGYSLDNSLTPAITLLQQIYYILGDEENLERVRDLN